MPEIPNETEYWIEVCSTIIEWLAVIIITFTVIYGTLVFIIKLLQKKETSRELFRQYRHRVARTLLLGLEMLVAADIIDTVVLEPTLQSIIVLGLLVLIRTFLSWSLVVEIEGRWPWQPKIPETGSQERTNVAT